MSNFSSLIEVADSIRFASKENENTALKIGSLFLNIIKELELAVENTNLYSSLIEHFHNIDWGDTDNVNDFLTTGVYNIAGIHSRGNDNLPISVGENATFNATLTVLDSTINVLGGIDGGACITQILSISDRVEGEGNVYIRTGRGSVKIPDAISWDSWSVQTTITDVGVVKDEQHSGSSGWLDGKGMNSLGKAGFYRGLYFDNKNREESFFLLVIDSSPAINAEVSVFNYVTQIKYGLPINGGEISLKVRMGLPKQNDLGGFIEGEFDWGEWKDFGGDSTPTVSWLGQNLNDYTTAGVYNIKGNRVSGDNMPILNEGVISARLTVLSTDDGSGNTVVTQVLSLNNNSGGEGNVYIRSAQKGSWKPWGKLQTNVEVGQVNTLDNLVDNGMYSGVLMTDAGFDTFVLVVINNYAAAVPAGFGWYVAQLKYSLGLDGSVTVKTRRMDYTNSWSEWEELKGGATGGGGSNNITRYFCDEIYGETPYLNDMIPKNVGDISIIIGDHYYSPLLTTTTGDTAYCIIELQNYNLLKFKFYDSGKHYYLELEDTTDIYGYKPGGGLTFNGNNVIRGVIGTGVTVKFDTSLRYDLKMGYGTLKFFNGDEYKSYVDCNVRSIGLSSSKAIVESSNGNEIVVQQISTN